MNAVEIEQAVCCSPRPSSRVRGMPFALTQAVRPARGWVRAIRDALGMTTKQLGQRVGVSQPRIVMLEKAEANGSLTLDGLTRAAEALGCRVVYTLVPITPLSDTLAKRAGKIAKQHLASIEQTIRLEGQAVSNPGIARAHAQEAC